ncbi:hypothetical protein C8J56DRAFT_246886 [Mycena floridula]|nr:hypothetical protein C8J56DRAFT_275045 [Mycena floridula]KAJ7582360.1 hypothetical protein C8J56DRAFT_246886 [Mycena floridula]
MAQIYYILDDVDDQITYNGLWIRLTPPEIYYGGSSTFFNGTCNIQFEGIGISLVGQIFGQNISVSVDNGSPVIDATFSNASYSTFYQSPQLSDGSHSVSISHDSITAPSLDFGVVQAGPSTNLVGKTLAVDDTYPGIQYDGTWSPFQYGPGTGFVAFQSNIHQTSTAGSSFTFTYTGTNMTVYGIYEESTPGSSFALTTTVDNASPPSTQTFTGNLTSELIWLKHISLFTTGDLEPGQHTVTVELSKCDSDQILTVDYIAYTPSFSSLAEMPATTSSGIAKKPVGAIVGGVIGGLVLLGLLGLFLVWRRKHRGKRQSRRSLPAYMDTMALKAFPGKPDRVEAPRTEAGLGPAINDSASVMDSEKI